MSQYLFLRAYMAGLVPPTVFALAIYIYVFFGEAFFGVHPPPLQRYIIFPLVVVPNLWGAWNGLYAVLSQRLPLAFHGALLPIVNFGVGAVTMNVMNVPVPDEMKSNIPMSLAISMVAHYLTWKYVMSFLNSLVDID